MTLRKFRKTEAATALKQAIDRRLELEELVRMAARSTSEMERELVKCLNPSGRAAEIVIRQNALSYQRTKEQEILAQLQKARVAESNARDAVKQAQMEEEAMVRLRDKQKLAHRVEQDKEEERAAMEFVSAVHQMRRG